MKVFINRLVAVFRQRGGEIPLPQQALYVAMESRLNLKTLRDPSIIPAILEDYIGTGGELALPALHFGVTVNNAHQILLVYPVQQALEGADADSLAQLADKAGFTHVCEEFVRDNANGWVSDSPRMILVIAGILGPLHPVEDAFWSDVWRMLGERAKKIDKWSELDGICAKGMIQLLKKQTDDGLARRLVAALAISTPTEQEQASDGGLEEGADESRESEDLSVIGEWISAVGAVLREVEGSWPGMVETSFLVAGSAGFFLRAARCAAAEGSLQDIYRFLKPVAPGADILDTFATDITAGRIAKEDADMVRLLMGVSGEWPWEKVVVAFKEALNASKNPGPEHILTGFSVLMLLQRISPEPKNAMIDIAKQGHLFDLIYRCKAPKHLEARAMGFLWAIAYSPVERPTESPGNASLGWDLYQKLTQAPQDDEPSVQRMAQLCRQYDWVERMVLSLEQETTKPLVQAVVRQILSDGMVDNTVDPALFVSHYPLLDKICDDELLARITTALVERNEFLNRVREAGFEDMSARMYIAGLSTLDDIDGDDTHSTGFAEFVKNGLARIPSDKWLSYLCDENDIVALAIQLGARGIVLRPSMRLHDALVDHAKKLIDGTTRIERFAERWDALLSVLDEEYHGMLPQTILSDIVLGLGTESLASILDVYGSHILNVLRDPSSGQADANRLVSIAFRHIMDRKNASELMWVREILSGVPELMDGCAETIKNDFERRVTEALRTEGLPEDVTRILKRIAQIRGILGTENDGAQNGPQPSEMETPPE